MVPTLGGFTRRRRSAGPGAQRHGATLYQIALAWLLAHSPAMLVIPGTSSVSHLEENIAAAEIRLSDERSGSWTRYIPSMSLVSRDNTSATPPMLKHRREVKAQHRDTILFYRVGDFYEMFFDDASSAPGCSTLP